MRQVALAPAVDERSVFSRARHGYGDAGGADGGRVCTLEAVGLLMAECGAGKGRVGNLVEAVRANDAALRR